MYKYEDVCHAILLKIEKTFCKKQIYQLQYFGVANRFRPVRCCLLMQPVLATVADFEYDLEPIYAELPLSALITNIVANQ
jgi:hypothetical protein